MDADNRYDAVELAGGQVVTGMALVVTTVPTPDTTLLDAVAQRKDAAR
jgi:hypothetical protein